jgi:hypothetical protein
MNLLRFPVRVPKGKESVVEPVRGFDLSGSSLEVIPEDGFERVLLRVDSPLQVDDVRLVPLGFRTERAGGGPSLQAFDIEGESLFDDVEE